jgi:hypothetical protein
MSSIGRTISYRSPPPIRACIDSGPPIRRCTDSRGEQVYFVILGNNLRHCVIKWRDSIKILTDLESIYQGLSYEVLHDMVPSISKFDLVYTIFYLSPYHEGHTRLIPKSNQLNVRPYATCTPSLELICLKILEK